MPPGVTVEELTQANLEEYAQTNCDAWGQPADQAAKTRDSIRRDFANPNISYRSFLARFNGSPAATGMLRVVNGSGYLLGGACRPEFRGRGLYRGLVAHRLAVLKREGVKMTLILARSSTSAPICRKLGFQVACECRSYEFDF
jgi:hypothetical protein